MHKTLKITFQLLLLSLIVSNCAFRKQSKDTPSVSNLTANISMPINVTPPAGDRIHLSVDIPQGYKCLQPTLNSAMLEFVPASDLDNPTWSEIITTMVYGGKKIQAKQFVNSIKNYVLQIDPSAKIIEENAQEEKAHIVATLKIKYKFNNRIEIMHAQYFSGPYDCSGYQYSIALSNKMNEAAIVRKINKFVTNNVRMIQF